MTPRLLPAVALLLVAAACGQARAADQTAAGQTAGPNSTTTISVTSPILSEDLVVTAATITRAINRLPLKADSILTSYSYTPETFEHLMNAIAADSAKSASYAAEMR